MALALQATAKETSACDLALVPPSFDAAAGAIRAGAVRGPGCGTATRVVVDLKERVFGVDHVLARGERVLRDGRVGLVHGCAVPRDMTVYVQVGDTRETIVKSDAAAIAGCG